MFSMLRTQDESCFAPPYDEMDPRLHGRGHDVPLDEMARSTGLNRQQVERVCRDLDAKRRALNSLRLPPLFVHQLRETVSPCAALPE
jgi:NH3-dependent NAD+ synthetase